MTLPTYKVEVAWASTPFAVTPTFTDNSSDVVLTAGVAISFGRPDQYSRTSPSTASFKLANKTGKYTPDNTGSSLYPNVLIGKAVRITANEGGASSARFYGFIDSITVNFSPNGAWSDVDITAVDLLSLLGRRRLPFDLIHQYMVAGGNPVDYWQLGDAQGTVRPLNIGAGLAGAKTVLAAKVNPSTNPGSVEFGTATGPGTDGLSAASVTNSYLYSPNPQAYNSSINCFAFINVETFDSTQPPVIFWFASAGVAGCDFKCSIDANGYIRADLTGAPVGTGITLNPGVEIPAVNVADGNTHCIHFKVFASGTTTATISVDGVLLGSSAAGAGGWIVYPYRFAQTGDAITASTGVMTMAQLAVFRLFTTWPVVADVAAAGLTGFAGETSAARFTRIAGFYGVTPTVPATPGAISMGGMSDITGASVLDLLQGVDDTENGLMYVDPSGVLTLIGRPSLYNQTAALSLTAGMYQPDLQFTLDTSQFVNDVTATGTSGVAQEYSDATSITNYGTSSAQVPLNTTLDAEALAYAQWRVGTGNPVTRSPQISIDLLTQQTAHATLLALWWAIVPGQLISVAGLPTSAPASSVTLQVEGWTETLTDQSYDVTINTAPNPGNYWKLGNATYGLLGATTILSY